MNNPTGKDSGREFSYAERFKARLIKHRYDRNPDLGNAYTLGALDYILHAAKAATTAEEMRAEIDKGLQVLAAFDELTNHNERKGGGRP